MLSRIGAFLVDLILAFIVAGILARIPFLGWFLGRPALVACLLLRDVRGASVGKHLLGLRVESRFGTPIGANERIMRNWPLAIGPAISLTPLAGDLGAPAFAFCLAVETLVLLVKKERIGDIMADTKVVKKSSL